MDWKIDWHIDSTFSSFFFSTFSAPNFTWNINSTRDLAIYVEPENSTSIIPNPELCILNSNEDSQKPLLLIVICSGMSNFKARQAIRETWMSITKPNNTNETLPFVVRTVFLLGLTVNDTGQNEVFSESNAYGDIIQEGFIDAYLNL